MTDTSTHSTGLAVVVDIAVAAPGAGSEAAVLASVGEALDVVVAAERAGATAVRLLDEASGTAGAEVLDPTVLAGFLAGRTSRLGYVVDVPTTHHAPYNVARRVLSLDRATAGRVGVAVRPGRGDEVSEAVAPDPGATDPGDRWDEYVRVLDGLWESFPAEALVGDQAGALFARDELIRPVGFEGQFYRVRGPLDGPASLQGRPVHVVVDRDVLDLGAVARTADVVVVVRDRAAGASDALSAALADAGRARGDVALLGRLEVGATALEHPERLVSELREWARVDALDGFDLVPVGRVRDVALRLLELVVPGLARNAGATLRDGLDLAPVATRRSRSVPGAA